jgi:RNA polymerase sigma factor (sigma-70 family)
MNDTTVEQILARLQTGDESALADLAQAFEPFLRGLVRRRMPKQVQGRFDSADVVQSAWASLVEGLCDARWEFPDAVRLRAFLTRVVLCRLVDRTRTALLQTNREEPLPNADRGLMGTEPRPSEHARAEATWTSLLAICPPEHQQVVLLRRLGHTCSEIAEETGMHPGSVRRVLRQLACRIAYDGN